MRSVIVNDISKLYHLGGSPVTSFRDLLAGFAKRGGDEKHDLWALRDVSFEVEEGETLGIIGRNGAGKSTLLKILSRITKPTSGFAEIHGRVSSLLEVGTGFHTELSGRENVYLNGAILGMKRAEIARKFDEIVAFSEIEQFLDTPIKFYSTGMHMRLAFAVAAHLEPEILIVDEVLAVGDAEFQKKCLGKMDEVSRSGRTVIFVSHQLGSVAQLCREAILLDKGKLVMKGKTDDVIERYVSQAGSTQTAYTADASARREEMHITRSNITDDAMAEQSTFRHDQAVVITVDCAAEKMVRGAELRMVVRTDRGVTVFTADADLGSLSDSTDEFEAVFTIPAGTLRPHSYAVTLALFIPHQRVIELLDDVIRFSIFDSGSKYAQSEGMDYGVVFSPCKVSVREIK